MLSSIAVFACMAIMASARRMRGQHVIQASHHKQDPVCVGDFKKLSSSYSELPAKQLKSKSRLQIRRYTQTRTFCAKYDETTDDVTLQYKKKNAVKGSVIVTAVQTVPKEECASHSNCIKIMGTAKGKATSIKAWPPAEDDAVLLASLVEALGHGKVNLDDAAAKLRLLVRLASFENTECQSIPVMFENHVAPVAAALALKATDSNSKPAALEEIKLLRSLLQRTKPKLSGS